MAKEIEKKLTNNEKLRRLEVGESIVFPIEKLSSIKAAASEKGLIWNRVFRSEVNRQARTVTIYRDK